ncbi:MAG: hypothetical protein H8D45_14380 [Bacteroidetes bacterium]|nr:hypothetical protein [Bacteroidota bacterium]
MEEKHYFLICAIILYVVVVYLFSRLGKSREIGPRRLFWLSLFLTPIIGIAFYLSSQELKMIHYTERKFKCERCGYVFSEDYPNCPFCEKEGVNQELKPVDQIMT